MTATGTAWTGTDLILAERTRQVRDEKFDAAHDANHQPGELSAAGECYIMYANVQLNYPDRVVAFVTHPPEGWPWDRRWWKPAADPARNLVKGGALIAAALDRMMAQAGAASG